MSIVYTRGRVTTSSVSRSSLQSYALGESGSVGNCYNLIIFVLYPRMIQEAESSLLLKYYISICVLCTRAMEQKRVFPPSLHGKYASFLWNSMTCPSLMWRERNSSSFSL